MSSVNGVTSSIDYSTLLGSTSTSSGSSSSSLLTDWASIKNGSYGKLTKAYYSNQTTTTKEEAKEITKSNTLLKSNTDGAMSALSKLGSASLYEKVTKKDADGKETTDYDYDKIVSALKDFVSSYNSIVDSADDSDNKGILRNASGMTGITARNQNMLSKIGITVGENNKLTLDEETAKKATVTDIQSLFMGQGSYGSQIESRATGLINYINAENNKLSTYTAGGSYDTSGTIGSIYDGTY